MESSPFKKGLLFLGWLISSLCLLLVLSIGLKLYYSNWHEIKIHKLKFVVCLIIRRDFVCDLPLCMIFNWWGTFNLNPTWVTAKIASLKIILGIVKADHWEQTKKLSVMRNILTKHIIASVTFIFRNKFFQIIPWV